MGGDLKELKFNWGKGEGGGGWWLLKASAEASIRVLDMFPKIIYFIFARKWGGGGELQPPPRPPVPPAPPSL